MSIREFNKIVGTLPEFDSAAAALSYLRGFTGGQQRAVVRHRGKFYVCSPSTARRCSKRVVAAY